MVTGLESIGITTSDKIIITSNGILRKLQLSFKFLRLSHSSFGGCTNIVTSVGFSKGCGIQCPVNMSQGIAASVMDYVYPAESGTSIEPLSTRARPSKCTASLEEILTEDFIVPLLFSKTNCVHRRFTDAEVLSMLDSQVLITKAVNENNISTELRENKELAQNLIPLIRIQEASRILFRFEIPKEERHVIPIYDVARLGPEVTGLQDIYSEFDQAKVAKSDDTKADTTLWDDQVFSCPDLGLPDDLDPLLVNTDHRRLGSEKAVLLSFLRTSSQRRYRKNVQKSFNKYMKTSHGFKVFGEEGQQNLDDLFEDVAKSLKTKEAKLDLVEGLQAITKVNESSFWDWNNGSFPHFWK